MKNLLMYQADAEAKREIADLLQDRGCLKFADTETELFNLIVSSKPSKVYINVHTISDIHLLHTVRSFGSDIEIVIIVSSELYDIIELLRWDNLRILRNILEDCKDILHKEKKDFISKPDKPNKD